MTDDDQVYTEGVCGDSAVILCNGQMMSITDILVALNAIGDPLDAAQFFNAAAENLRSADEIERLVDAVFRIAYRLDEIAKRLYSLERATKNPPA